MLFKHQAGANVWSKLIRPELLQHLLDKQHIEQKRWPLWGALVLWAITTVGLAGPTWKQLPQDVEQTTEALVICWDLSPSMLAQDVKPSRLQRARLKIIDLLKARDEGLFALVAYSGEAYNVTPLTDDIQTLINLLPSLSPAHLPTVGSNPEMALENAQKLLKDAGAAHGHIVFITDDIAANAMTTMKDTLSDSPYKLTLWPVGTPEGAPIPLPQGGFAKDGTGNMVVPKLPTQKLQRFAKDIGAYYVPMGVTDDDVNALAGLLTPQHQQTKKTERHFDQWFEHGQYIPLLLLPFLTLLFRRGWLFCFALILPVTLITPERAHAFGWQDLWQTQDQQAQEQLNNGNAAAAADFTTAERRASALYNQDKFAEAAQEYQTLNSANDQFNRGTALTQAGNYKDAIKAFDQALALNPELNAAKANKAIAEQLANMQQQSEQEQQKDGEDGKDSEKNQNQDSPQNSEEQQSQNGQNSDNQNQQQDQNSSDSNEQSADESNAEQNQANEGQPGENSDKSSQEGQKPENADPEDNPYSQLAQEDKSNSEEPKPAEAQEQENDEQADPQSQQTMALSGAQSDDKSDEEKQLEMMLRKVPDNPGGLLREKFKYQYQQRRRDPTRTMTNNEAENRW